MKEVKTSFLNDLREITSQGASLELIEFTPGIATKVDDDGCLSMKMDGTFSLKLKLVQNVELVTGRRYYVVDDNGLTEFVA